MNSNKPAKFTYNSSITSIVYSTRGSYFHTHKKKYYFSKIRLVSHYFYQIMIMIRPLCQKKSQSQKKQIRERKEETSGFGEICVRIKNKKLARIGFEIFIPNTHF